MVNVEARAIAAAPLPPPVRPLVTIKSCEWTDKHVIIVYHCACSNCVHIRVYRNGYVFHLVRPLNDSVEKRNPTVNATWDNGRVEILSTCECTAGCRFTREEGGSGLLQVIA